MDAGATQSFERSLAIVIGINSYSHGVPALHNAVRDATALADTLERQGFEVIRLLDSQASLQALSDLFSSHLPTLDPPPDRLVIYFAGHGLAHTDDRQQLNGFLLPADARRDVQSSYWPMASLREALRRLPCRHLLLVLDCCFAGAFPHAAVRDLRPAVSSTPLYLERFRHFSSHRSFQLLLSTAHDELASDRLLAKPSQESLGDGQHSPFALALLQALQPRSPADFNQDGLLTASELYTFLRDWLVTLLPAPHQQTPSLWNLDWHDGGEFLFCLSNALPQLPSAAPLSKDFNPYLGLRPFSAAQRHLFFGRERDIDTLREHLRAHPLLLLCGSSGAGKSSLVHAGLLPRLSESASWHVPPSLRPSAQPLQALASWLSSLVPGDASPSAAALASRPEGARDFLRSVLARRPELSLLLVIDPLEELVTACLDNHRRGAFLRALASILQLAHPRLRAVLLLRSDFEPHFLSLLPGTSFPLQLWHANRLTVPPMNRDELRRCIEKPAEVRTLFFTPGLVERLLDDVEQMPGALPLLSVALSELFDAYLDSGREDRTLSFADYERLGGGIAGALQRRAELIFSGVAPLLPEGQPGLPPLSASELPTFQRTLRNVLLRMVSPEGGEPARRRVRRAELEYPHPEENARVQRALLTLEAGRLIVASDDSGPCVEPAHDALLTAWPRLHDWVRQTQRELLLLRRISHAASEWAHQGRAVDFLWTDARLDQLGLAPASLHHERAPLALPISSPGSQPIEPLAFNEEESAFLRASAVRRRFLRRRRYALQSMATAIILLMAVIALVQAASARREQLRAEETAVQLREEKSAVQQEKLRAEANAENARRQEQTALANAQEASKARQAADDNARRASQQQEIAEAQAREASRQQEIAEAQAREASRQQGIAEAQAQEARHQRELARTSAQRAQEQEQAAVASAQEAQRQQEAADTNARRAQQQEQAAVASAQEAQQQRALAENSAVEAYRQQYQASLSAEDARIQRDAASTQAQKAQAAADRALFSAKLAQAEGLLNEDPTKAALILQEAISTTPPPDIPWLQTALAIHQQDISEAVLTGLDYSVAIPPRFSPDGSRVLALSGGTLYLWRSDGTGQPLVLTRSEKPPYSATFSPDGSFILAYASNTVLLWRTDRAEPPRVLMETKHPANLGNGSFSPDGSLLLITANNVLRVWRTDDSAPPANLELTEAPVDSATFSPDGSLILLNTADGTTELLRADGTSPRLTLSTPAMPAYSAQFSPNGSLIVARSGAALLLWRTGNPTVPRVAHTPVEFLDSVTFSPRGDHLLATSSHGEVIVWRVTGQELPVVLSPPSVRMRSARFSPDGRRILALAGNAVYFWNLEQAGEATVLAGSCDYMKSAQLSPDGGRIATLCLNGTAVLWKMEGQEEPQVLSSPAVPVSSLTFSPDGHSVVTSSGNSAQIWRTDVQTAPRTLNGHTQDVQHVVFSADGTRLLTTAGNSIRVWRTRPPGSVSFPRGVTPGVADAAVTPDGSLVVTTSVNYSVHLWSTENLRPPRAIAGPSAQVFRAAFTADGSRILTYAFDGTRRVWQIDGTERPLPADGDALPVNATREEPKRSRWGSLLLKVQPAMGLTIESTDGQSPPVLLPYTGLSQAFFFPDGMRIATLSPHELRIWPLAPSLISDTLSRLTTTCLSMTERIKFLREEPTDAQAGFHQCERSHGRDPEAQGLPPASNPIDDPSFFVNQLYLDLLERPPSPSERRQLISLLEFCGRHAGCLHTTRREAAQILFESPEHRSQQNLYEGPPSYAVRYATCSYTSFTRRQPEGDGELFWPEGVPSDVDYAAVIESFLVAPRYRERFGPP